MNSALISLMVTAAFFAVAVVVGFRLGRTPKPYPIPLLSIHIVLFVLIAVGIGACMNKIEALTKDTAKGMSLATVSLCLAGPPLIASLVSGLVMIWARQKKRGWILAHKVAMYLLALSIAAAVVFTVVKR